VVVGEVVLALDVALALDVGAVGAVEVGFVGAFAVATNGN